MQRLQLCALPLGYATVERTTGIEPAASCLGSKRTTFVTSAGAALSASLRLRRVNKSYMKLSRTTLRSRYG